MEARQSHGETLRRTDFNRIRFIFQEDTLGRQTLGGWISPGKKLAAGRSAGKTMNFGAER